MRSVDPTIGIGGRARYAVEVVDPPYHPLGHPVRFTLGPFPTREEAERMARRARDTSDGTETRVVER